MQLRDLGEFDLIARIERAARSTGRRGVVVGIGDDAALLRARAGEDWVVSTDARVEDVHFRWSTDPPHVVGRTALAAALSDLAAMGARPRGFTWSLAAPGDLPLASFDALLRGLVDGAKRHACPLVGGNLSSAGETSLALTVFGVVARGRALRRRAAIGDRILVTGELGTSALARARAERTGTAMRWVPSPRLGQGRALVRLRAVSGCIDVSDGLEADLGHLLGRGRRCEFDPTRIPVRRGFARACRELGLDPVALALGGGDDYELLFAVRGDAPSADALARRLGVRVTELGRVEAGSAAPGRSGGPRPAGWTHFAGRPGPCR